MHSNPTPDLFKDLDKSEPRKIKETSLGLLAQQKNLDRLDFNSLFNGELKWDDKQWSVTPANLAKSIIYLPYFSEEKRIPVYKIDQSYESVDMELLFDPGIKASNFNDDNIGRMLDRFHEAGCSRIFTKLSLGVYEKFNLEVSNILHADTTTHVLYGQYDIEFPEECNGPIPKRGHSKAKRFDLKQVVQGMVTDGNGMPIYVDICDGNKADCVWNKETISKLCEFMGDLISDSIYIADSKFTTQKNFELLNGMEYPIKFISRVPASFCSKTAEKAKKEAFEKDQWNDIGTSVDEPSKESELTKYQAFSIDKKIYAHKCRLIVYKSDEHEHKIKSLIEVDKEEIEEEFNKTFSGKKHIFSCEADTIKAVNLFEENIKKGLHDVIWGIEEIIEYIRPRGRPSKNAKPPKKVTTYRVILKEIRENNEKIEEFRKKKRSFVLVTNIEESEMDEKVILRKYKEQKVVEDNFSIIKRPILAHTSYLHKPERIEALLTLLSISLLLQIVTKLVVRRNLQKLDFVPNLDNHRKPLINPTSKKIIDMIRNYSVITSGKYRELVVKNSMFADGLAIWSFLVGLSEHQPSKNSVNCKSV